MASEPPPLLRPKPRRPFLSTKTIQSPQPPSPLSAPNEQDETPSRTHSILNLTSSTLLGIFSATGYQDDRDTSFTPWGTEAVTPSEYHSPISLLEPSSPSRPVRRGSISAASTPGTATTVFLLASRILLLFCIGMLYGLLVRHLHYDRQLAPFQVEGIIKPRQDWGYLVFWGVSGVALGSLLPWVDGLWEKMEKNAESGDWRENANDEADGESDAAGTFGPDWTPVVRSIGAFVGISYAIRKLPWTSPLQASLTLFLVNPVLWYMIDRSRPGFLFSSFVGAIGTTLLMFSNPTMMPSPKSNLSGTGSAAHNVSIADDGLGVVGRYASRETIENGIWILSVLFCSCVCFGNVGRRLALSSGPATREKERELQRERDILVAAKAFLGKDDRRQSSR